MLELWALCPRAKCARRNTCKGDARICIEQLARHTPLAAREFIVDVLNAREFGYTPEQAVRNYFADRETESAAREAVPAARS